MPVKEFRGLSYKGRKYKYLSDRFHFDTDEGVPMSVLGWVWEDGEYEYVIDSLWGFSIKP